MNIKSYKYKKGVELQKINPYIERPETVTLPVPAVLAVPLKQYKGVLPSIMVEEGERVEVGSVLAKGRTNTIYSPSAGTIIGFEKRPSVFGGSCLHILIERSESNVVKRLPELDMEQLTPEILIKRIFDAGIVNNDGVPLYQKLILKEEDKAESLVVNACTDEMFMSTNVTMLNSLAVEVISGAIYTANCIKVTKIIIAVTEGMVPKVKPFLDVLKEYDGEFVIEIASVPDRYPVGDERELVNALTGKEIAGGKTSMQFGMAVVDLACCYSVFEAVSEGVQDTRKLISILGVGDGGKESCNAWVMVGTPLDFILQTLRPNDSGEVKKIVAGGLMRGVAVAGLESATTKNLKGIVFVGAEMIKNTPETNCIGCGRCSEVCPRRLLPYQIEQCVMDNDFVSAKKFGAEYCTKCGSCEYVCPANRRLVQRIQYGKQTIKDKGVK